jgi:hypothetical protein
MPETTVIDVARDFTRTPGGRYRNQGEWSGEQFREEILEPPLKRGGDVIVDLDGPEGFTTSFLDEVFGELVRIHGLAIMDRLHVRAIRRPSRARKVQGLVEQADQERRGGK